MANIEELSRYISDEMRRNVRSGEAKQIAVLRKQSFTHPVALAAWARLVDYGERWDHKDKILKRFGPWSTDLPTKHDYFLDVWSNIHYGYIGLSVGFDEGLLKLGAGLPSLNKMGLLKLSVRNAGRLLSSWLVFLHLIIPMTKLPFSLVLICGKPKVCNSLQWTSQAWSGRGVPP